MWNLNKFIFKLDATGLSSIVMSSPNGVALNFSYYEGEDDGGDGGGDGTTDIPGCTDSNACNYNLDATLDDILCIDFDWFLVQVYVVVTLL